MGVTAVTPEHLQGSPCYLLMPLDKRCYGRSHKGAQFNPKWATDGRQTLLWRGAEEEQGADLHSPEGSWLHDPLDTLQWPRTSCLTHRVALRKLSPIPLLSIKSVGYPHLCISCPLLVTLSVCNPNGRPRLGGNNSQLQLLSVLSMMCSLNIQQDFRF